MSRRTVLAGACSSCAAVAAGCATYTTGRPAPTEITAAPAPGGAVLPAAGAGGALVATVDIPVGGGKVFAEADVVVTQPREGTFVAFAATCTHQGCTVSTITGDTVNCPCHGSKFALADGSVVRGPAKKALPAKKITVANGQITLA